MFDNKSVYTIKRPIKKSGENSGKIALRRNKRFSTSIVSIRICSNSRRIPVPL